ncbi:hypothetical protein HMPREF3293_03095 [Christensenella minuta]|uniref:Uncharacterized protein n=1 Tax=Christensenella minuta TaxID=626937 RepID=A0A136Q068_9FIRM|nr:hypothetical protein HMPREF3293_03095 [Christensenella minuta]
MPFLPPEYNLRFTFNLLFNEYSVTISLDKRVQKEHTSSP